MYPAVIEFLNQHDAVVSYGHNQSNDIVFKLIEQMFFTVQKCMRFQISRNSTPFHLTHTHSHKNRHILSKNYHQNYSCSINLCVFLSLNVYESWHVSITFIFEWLRSKHRSLYFICRCPLWWVHCYCCCLLYIYDEIPYTNTAWISVRISISCFPSF